MAQRSELDYLIYNDPLGYADLILNGDPEGYLKIVAGSHGLEDETQTKNRVRPPGRTLPKATDNSDMYSRAFPVGNALFFFAGGVMSLLRLP